MSETQIICPELLRIAEKEMARRLKITSTFQVITIAPIFLLGVLRRPDIWELLLASMLIIVGASAYIFYMSSRFSKFEGENSQKWFRRIFAGVSFSGLAWGSYSCIFLHLNHKELLSSIIVVFLAAANCSSAITTYIAHRRIGYSYLLFFLGVPFVYLLVNFSKLNLTLASFLVLFFTYLISQVRVHQGEFIESLVEGRQLQDNRSRAAEIVKNLDEQIAEREKIEERLINTREEALELTRAKSEFLANMSHEIRTPMNGILGMTDILVESGLNPVQSNHVQTIQECGAQLLRTINDLLDFSKLEAHKMELEKETFHLGQILEKSIASAQNKAKNKKISLSLFVAEDVPSYLTGDAVRLQQIISQLVDNAIKFTEVGGVNVEVGLTQSRSSQQSLQHGKKVEIQFNIIDTGIGIPKARLYGIFEAFSQLDSSTSRKYGGTGLGLAIAKKLVGLMGGEIWAQSLLGIGSTFSFTIQLPKAENVGKEIRVDEGKRVPQHNVSSNESTLDFTSLQVLVVEDNLVNQTIIKKILEKMEIHFILAEDGETAVELASKNKFDLILMDLQLPGISGSDAAREIQAQKKKLGERVRIIALTAGLTDEEEKHIKSQGICEILLKPLSLEGLKKQLLKCLQEKKV